MVGPSFLLLHLIAKPVDRHSAGSVWGMIYKDGGRWWS